MNNKPTASIARNKSRLKTYGENVYLKNGDNFEIELFNGHSHNVMAKIWINDVLISTSGLVLKPGQRYFLERFIDSNNKFKFETYEVDGSEEAKKAIVNNGLVKVEFFKETVWQQPNTWQQPFITTTNYPWNPSPSIGNPGVYFGTTSSNVVNCTSDNSANAYFTTTSIGHEGVTANYETGRVEKGEKSNQSFGSIDMNFEQFAFATSKWHILPYSLQPIEVSQLRNYCSGCGTRVKKQSWKFCPSCGESLD